MNLIFFDQPVLRNNLKPFTLTRPISGIRCGILRLGEKWERRLVAEHQSGNTSNLTEGYLQAKFPLNIEQDNLLVNPAVCPDESLTRAVQALDTGQVLRQDEIIIAVKLKAEALQVFQKTDNYEAVFHEMLGDESGMHAIDYDGSLVVIAHLWDIFLQNGEQIARDFELITTGRKSQEIRDPHTIFYGDRQKLFIEEGADIKASVLNAESGPIYIGKNAVVHENAVLLGPMALLDHSHINIGSKIREATTIGPHSKLGGEVKNVVVFGNSNKGHEGFLGNSVIGEWCNFGADTNNSNLKNNYQPVKLWNYGSQSFENTGELFCGLMMGDHSKCGINTMFNTGTVVGVSANIFGSGYQPKFIPSFSWGGAEESSIYRLDKAREVALHVMKRRGISFSNADAAIMDHVFENRRQETKTTS